MLRKLAITLALTGILLSVSSPVFAVNDPGGTPRPVLEDLWVFCKPGQSVILSVRTRAGNGYAVWTYDYNPLTPGWYDTNFAGVLVASTNPAISRIPPGDVFANGVHFWDEILLVYVYGIPLSNEDLLISNATHCE